MEQQRRQQAAAAREAGIVAEERVRLLRGAVHLRDYLPRHIVQDMQRLQVAA